MKREIIQFTTKEDWLANRAHDLTSSDIPSLFNVGYQSYEEVFKTKLNGLRIEIEPSERMDWGTALEPAIAGEFARKNKWTIRSKKEYIRLPELRIGSSFDYEISNEDMNISENGNFLMEVKNVGSDSYNRDWLKGFSIEAPAKIELQIQNELLVSGFKKCFLCVLIGGNKGICLIREPNLKIQEAILKKAANFWRSIDESNKN